MKIVIQRVQSASVVIEDSTVGAIKQGALTIGRSWSRGHQRGPRVCSS